MLGFLSSLTGGGVSKVVESVGGVVAKFTGDKTQQEANRHSEVMQYSKEQEQVLANYAAEFLQPEKKKLINQIVDALNRLVRPMFTYGIVGLFVFACVDPEKFAIVVQSLAIIPEMMWYVMMTIISFWFGGRLLEKAAIGVKPVDPNAVKAIVEASDALNKKRGLFDKNNEGVIEISESQFQDEMKDTSKPLSNAAILEWNKRNKQS